MTGSEEKRGDGDAKVGEPTPRMRPSDNKFHVGNGDDDANQERQTEQQLKRHGGAKHFREIRGGDGNLGQGP